jgi:hypothetical protein
LAALDGTVGIATTGQLHNIAHGGSWFVKHSIKKILDLTGRGFFIFLVFLFYQLEILAQVAETLQLVIAINAFWLSMGPPILP